PSIKVRLPGIFTQVRAGSLAVNADVRRPRATCTPSPFMVATGDGPLADGM
ncbi:MAG: hypothetical protein ACI89J_004604, partial [Hyphomicrobiaceae bacterium]